MNDFLAAVRTIMLCIVWLYRKEEANVTVLSHLSTVFHVNYRSWRHCGLQKEQAQH